MRTTGACRTIVVGIDGSDDSLAALDWAAEAASARDLTLDLVHCAPWTPPPVSDLFPQPRLSPGEDVVEEAVTRCRLTAAGVRVSATVTAAAPAGTLIELSGRAELVVIGAAGTGHAAGLGSVADVVASYARCPVVVVRGGPVIASAGRPVVVGIDKAGASTGVLGFAFDEAARRHTRIVALHGWDRRDEPPAAARTIVADALTGWHDKHPDVDIEERPVHAGPAEALAVESLSAALVVVGASDRPAAGATVLGPVSAELLGRSRCPVAVVRLTDPALRRQPWLRAVGPGGER